MKEYNVKISNILGYEIYAILNMMGRIKRSGRPDYPIVSWVNVFRF